MTALLLTLTTALCGGPEESWWSYRPLERPAVPVVVDASHPIDAFLAARLAGHGIRGPERAPREVLMRRAYLGLLGIPPTLEEQSAFLDDSSAGAWGRLIDRLLGSRHYGERWARYWLDLVRYADSNGYERDGPKPNVWRYRDYVIRSFNEDKPYDRFLLEQLAGDELEDSSAESVIATGYWALGPWNDEVDPLERPQYRADELDDLVMTTSLTFLASTVACARCHDHKFDPFTAVDYYRLVAVVEALKRPNQGRSDGDRPVGSRQELASVARRDDEVLAVQTQGHALWQPYRDSYRKSHEDTFDQEFRDAIAAIAVPPRKRGHGDWLRHQRHHKKWNELVFSLVPVETRNRLAALDREIEILRKATPDLPRSYVLFEDSPEPPKTYFLERGNPAARGEEMVPGVPAVLTTTQPEFLQPDGSTSRRRLSFARWVASAENPLTPRVIVNRVWQYHFGVGIVSTPSDFGRAGAVPTHPQLLDWLAHWFVFDAKWSLKKLQRLILSSETYQMSKRWRDPAGAKDPENKLLWRFPYRRLEVEAIRDSMLAVSGRLNKATGGPGVHFHIPEVVIEGHADKQKAWNEDPEMMRDRRTIYGYVKRSLMVPMIESLDFCDTVRSTAVRSSTTIAPQALILFNGEFVNRQARYFAERLRREVGDEPGAQIERAYRLALARAPTEREVEAMRSYLREESGGLEQLCRVVLNLNEFVYVD